MFWQNPTTGITPFDSTSFALSLLYYDSGNICGLFIGQFSKYYIFRTFVLAPDDERMIYRERKVHNRNQSVP